MKHSPFKITHTSLDDSSVHGFQTVRNEGDNFLFLPGFTSWIGRSFKEKNIGFFYFLLMGFIVLLLARAAYLQVMRGGYYRAFADGNRIKKISLKAPRGIFFDRYDHPLVRNDPAFYVYLNPRLIQNDDQAHTLQAFLIAQIPEDSDRINKFFKSYKRNETLTLIADDVPYEKALLLQIKSSNIAALQIASEPVRAYLYDDGLAHVFGYAGKVTDQDLTDHPDYSIADSIGKSGLEKQYEQALRGVDGVINIEVDALGREKSEVSRTLPKPGSDITLTIDLALQKKLYEALAKASANNNHLPAAGVIMDPQTGEVLAIASVPSYDPNLFSHALDQQQYADLVNNEHAPLFDRAVAGAYPAGSVFKMSVASAALDEHSITDTFTVNSTGGVNLGNRFFPDWKAGGHGITNIYKAISDSVNTFFYTIGGGTDVHDGIGPEKIIEYARKLGFGAPTGIDLPGEAAGQLPDPNKKNEDGERWYQGDTYNLSIGQGSLLVTPLQIAQYTSYFANGGKLPTPHMVKKIHTENADTIMQSDFKNKDAIITQNTIGIVRSGMRRTVVTGTAKSLQSVSVPVAGKTGTAQFNKNKSPHSWFTAFAPFDNPTVVASVIVEQGGDQGYAVGVTREVLEWYFSQKKS